MKVHILYVLANILSVTFCVLYYRRLMKKSLKVQREEYEKSLEKHTLNLIHFFNHYGPIPPGTSLLGLLSLTSLAIKRCVEELTKRYENKEYDTRTIIRELFEIDGSEIRRAIALVGEFIEGKRQQLEDFYKHQKLKNDT